MVFIRFDSGKVFSSVHVSCILRVHVAADGEVYHAKGGSKIRSCRVADKSGSINFSAWDEIGESVESGEVYRLNKG